MGFTPTKTDGNWASMRDLASEGEVLTIKKGFLVSDDSNVYEGKAAPRYIVKSISSDGEEVQTGVTKGYSRDLNLNEASEYLEFAPEGTVLQFRFVKTSGGSYIGLEFVGGDLAEA